MSLWELQTCCIGRYIGRRLVLGSCKVLGRTASARHYSLHSVRSLGSRHKRCRDFFARAALGNAKEGVATLTGLVHSYAEKIAAEKAAKSVYGVKAVANDIEVKPMTRTDPEIARDVIEAMKLDLRVPDDSHQGRHWRRLHNAGRKGGMAFISGKLPRVVPGK
jgi:BON domain